MGIAHANFCSFVAVNSFKNSVSWSVWRNCDFKVVLASWWTLELKVFYIELEGAHQSFVLWVFEIEDCCVFIVELEECFRVAELVGFLLLSLVDKFFVGKFSSESSVWKTVASFARDSSQNYDVVVAGRDFKLNCLLCRVWPDDLEALELRSEFFSQLILWLVVSIDCTIPAIEEVDVNNSEDIFFVVLILF